MLLSIESSSSTCLEKRHVLFSQELYFTIHMNFSNCTYGLLALGLGEISKSVQRLLCCLPAGETMVNGSRISCHKRKRRGKGWCLGGNFSVMLSRFGVLVSKAILKNVKDRCSKNVTAKLVADVCCVLCLPF